MDEIRQALGIEEDADPVAAIAGLHSEMVELRAAVKADKRTAEAADVGKLRNDLAAARQELIRTQAETAAELHTLRDEMNQERAKAKVEGLIAKGVRPTMRDHLLELATSMEPKKFDDFAATIPRVDLTEKGVATGNILAELEPDAEAIKVMRNVGAWDDAKPEESRLAYMRQQAALRNLTLPAEMVK